MNIGITGLTKTQSNQIAERQGIFMRISPATPARGQSSIYPGQQKDFFAFNRENFNFPPIFRIIIVFIALTGLHSLVNHVSADTIVLSDARGLLTIGKNLSYLEDKDKSLSIAHILTPECQAKFRAGTRDVFARPATHDVFWFKITFSNQSEEDAWLEFGTVAARYIDFFAPDSKGNYGKPIQTGVMRALNTRPYPVNTFWFPLSRAGNQTTITYYLRIDEETPFEAPIYIGSLKALHAHKSTNDYLVAGFMGAILIMLLYNAFLWLSTREKLYLVYVLYLLFSLLVPPAQNGYPFVSRLGNPAWWFDHLVFFMAVANFYLHSFNPVCSGTTPTMTFAP